MSNEITTLQPQGEVALRSEDAERVNSFSAPALSGRTKELYEQFGRRFIAWCNGNSYSLALPTKPELVSAWVSQLAVEGKSVSTIMIAVSAVRYLNVQAGRAWEPGPVITNTLANIRRQYADLPRQAAALKPDLLGDVLRSTPETLLDVRDFALLSCAYIFALRRFELVSLDLAQPGTPRGSCLVLGEDSLSVRLGRSKTAQESVETVSVPRDANPRAVGAIERWVRAADIADGSPVWRALTARGHEVTGRRITAQMASVAIKRCLARYYRQTGMSEADAVSRAAQFSGHSGRVGFVVAAVEAGASHEDIARVTRHAPGSAMVRRYGQTADQLRTSPHRLKGVGV